MQNVAVISKASLRWKTIDLKELILFQIYVEDNLKTKR
jgi:hypothetical protein